MSIIRVNQGDVEAITLTTNPIRSYSSSSLSGVTGSVHVFPRRSDIEKELTPLPAFLDATHDDSDLSAQLTQLSQVGLLCRYYASTDPSQTAQQNAKFHSMIEQYVSDVDAQSTSARKQKALDIVRFTPTVTYTTDTVRKEVVKDILIPHYRTSYPTANWAYTNYNTLNFFTSSTVQTSSVLLYPNVDGPIAYRHDGYVSGTYNLSGAFSFDFYVNPRYTTFNNDGAFKAGTILHLSSSYALSLVTGSLKDMNGKPRGYRLQLQLSHSADVAPSLAISGAFPHDLIFLSDDNSLTLNNWHHVVVRWGTNKINDGTGSFNIDGIDRGTFVIPSGTVDLVVPDGMSSTTPDVLCVGNYYEGLNQGTSAQAYFFAADPATRDGLEQMMPDAGVNEPLYYAFNHPLNAELHDVSIKRYYMSNVDITTSSSRGPSSLDSTVALYIPPFFTEESPFRQSVGGYGGILQTPFFEIDGTTNDPFNVAMSFGVDGHYVNIENYLRDFANDTYPRVHRMSGTALTHTTDAIPANDFLYADPFVRRRNLLIMPCDDGNFTPNYDLLVSESLNGKYHADDSYTDYSYVNLSNMLSTSSLIFGALNDSVEGVDATSNVEFVNESIGFTPENPGLQPGPSFQNYVKLVSSSIGSGTYDPGIQTGAPLTIYQRTQDASSNQVTFFDISNLYYGKRIHPGTFVLTDSNLTGSGDAVSITLKDDGHGNLYRADCATTQATWNSCGNVFYDEGIVVIKNPHLYFFGKEQYEVSFKGEQNVHSLKIEVIAPQNALNSSSNPSYVQLPATSAPNDPDPNYVWITGLNFHDDNMNVVAKTSLAQPIMKRFGSRILFKCAIDM